MVKAVAIDSRLPNRQYVRVLGYWEEGNHIIMYIATSSRARGLNSIHLSLFHLCLIRVLHDRNELPTMDVVLRDVVASEVAYGFDRQRLAINLNLVAIYGFLDGSADVADTDVNTGSLGLRSCSCLPATAMSLP